MKEKGEKERGGNQHTRKMAGGIITTLMSDDWGREESAVKPNEKKRKTEGKKERENKVRNKERNKGKNITYRESGFREKF